MLGGELESDKKLRSMIENTRKNMIKMDGIKF